MKILITGFNKNQCTRQFYLGQQLKVVPSHYSLYNCLTDMGHTVEQRRVELGEDLSQYDEVIVFIAAPRQLVTTCLYNGLYAISQKPNCILASDDWAMPDLFKGVEKCLTGDDLICDFVLNTNKQTKEGIAPYISQFVEALRIIKAQKNRLLISAFDGGDLSLLMPSFPKENMYSYDPHPYHRNRKPGDCWDDGIENPDFKGTVQQDVGFFPHDQKRMEFNFASLVQSKTKKWLTKQGIKNWPINMIGSRADGQDRYVEGDMCRKIIAQQWGVLMPGYHHAGSGWWRTKFQQSADFGSIIIGDEKEMRVIYGESLCKFKAHHLEQMDLSQLISLSKLQSQAFYDIHRPLDKQKQQLSIRKCLES